MLSQYRFIIDLPTNRIVFYTDDLSQHLVTDEQCVIADYTGELPASMTEKNSWNYKFYDQKIISPTPVTRQTISITDQNRKTFIDQVTTKVNEKLAEFNTASLQFLNNKMEQAASGYLETQIDNKWLLLVQRRYGFDTQKQAADFVLLETDKILDMIFNVYNLKEHTLKKLKSDNNSSLMTASYQEFLKKLDSIDTVNNLL